MGTLISAVGSGLGIGSIFGLGLWLSLLGLISLRPISRQRSWPGFNALLVSANLTNQLVVAVGVASVVAVPVGMLSGSSVITLLTAASCTLAVPAALKAHRRALLKQAQLREKLLMPEFLDLVVIATGAGLSLRAAITAAVERSRPEVAEVWRELVSDTKAQRPLAVWLDTLVRGEPARASARVASALLIATERGTPVTAVLGALAQELRSETRRELVEMAARKDVQMMLPVVFGILPSVTAVALYPALTTLSALN